MSILGGAKGFIEKNNDYLLLAYTNVEIGTKEQFAEWWNGFTDIAIIPGLSEGFRLISERDQRPGQKPRWKYMVAFGYSGDAEKMKNAIMAHKFVDDSAIWFYIGINDLIQREYALEDTDEHIFMALTNIKPGRQEDFHDWYNKHHLPEVVATSHFRSGRRFRILATGGAEAQWEYLAFYRYVGSTLRMHRSLPIDDTRIEMVHSDAYKDDDGAWIYSANAPDRSKKYKIGVISGSLRKDSYCRHLADFICRLFPEDFEAVSIDIADLGMFSEDIEDNPPLSWLSFRKAISSVDAYLFVTPEYNRSFPGVLKNAIDIGSRPYGHSSWVGKPGAVAGASISALGGALAVQQLRQVLGFLNVKLMNDQELYLANVASVFGKDNSISNKDIDQYIYRWVGFFEAWVRENAF